MKVSIIFILFSLFYTYSHAHIVIDIEPDELQRVAEILVQSYLSQNFSPRTVITRNIVLSHIKKITSSTVQLCGIMITLVGANLLTKIFEPSIAPSQYSFADNITSASASIIPSELCKRDFGCDRNVCWRTCGEEMVDGERNKWCYTSPKSEIRDYQQCVHSYDCSPCWECIGVCHTRTAK